MFAQLKNKSMCSVDVDIVSTQLKGILSWVMSSANVNCSSIYFIILKEFSVCYDFVLWNGEENKKIRILQIWTSKYLRLKNNSSRKSQLF